MSDKDPHNSFTALEIEKVVSSTINLLIFGSGALLLFMSQRRKYLDKKSLVCIGFYLLSVIINCVYSIFDIVYEDQGNVSGKQIPTKTADFITMGVFFYFVLDLHLVKLMLECVT